MSGPIHSIEVLVTVREENGFWISRASLPEGGTSDEPRIVTDVCQSRDRNRAISYALAELAARLSR